MPKRIGRCTNFGGCNTADSKKAVEILETQDFVCLECKSNLLSADVPSGKSKKGFFIALFILLLGIGTFLVMTQVSSKKVSPDSVEVKGQVPPPVTLPQAPASNEVVPQPQPETPPKVDERPSKQEKQISKRAVKPKTSKKGSGHAPDEVDDETMAKNIKTLAKKLNNK